MWPKANNARKRGAWFIPQNPLRVLVAQGDNLDTILGYINLSNTVSDRQGFKISADIGLYIDQNHQGKGLVRCYSPQ